MVINFLDFEQSHQIFIEHSIKVDKKVRVYSLLFSVFSSLVLWPFTYLVMNMMMFPWVPGVEVNSESIDIFYRDYFGDLINQVTEDFEKKWILKRFDEEKIPEELIEKIKLFLNNGSGFAN